MCFKSVDLSNWSIWMWSESWGSGFPLIERSFARLVGQTENCILSISSLCCFFFSWLSQLLQELAESISGSGEEKIPIWFLRDSYVFRFHCNYAGALWKEGAYFSLELLQLDVLKQDDRLSAYSSTGGQIPPTSKKDLKSKNDSTF